MCMCGCPYEYNRGEDCNKPSHMPCWLESDLDQDEYAEEVARDYENRCRKQAANPDNREEH